MTDMSQPSVAHRAPEPSTASDAAKAKIEQAGGRAEVLG